MEDILICGTGIYLQNIDSMKTLSFLDIKKQEEFFFKPESVISKKGLRYKDLATKFAICAANKTLLDAGIISEPNQKINSSEIAIIVCSSLGNIDTIGKVMNIVKDNGVDETSPLDLPNLSCNNIAASIAIWFNLTGTNLTVCNGSTSSLDALQIGYNLLHLKKAKKALIIGVEVSNEYTELIKSTKDEENVQVGAVGMLLSDYDQSKSYSSLPSLDVPLSCNSTLYNECGVIELISKSTADLFIIPHEFCLRNNVMSLKRSKLSIDKCYGYMDGIYGILSSIYAISQLEKYKSICVIAGNNVEKYKCIMIKSITK